MTSANDLSGITTAILVGGLGTRLRSAVADRPKVLAEINGRPMLSYLLDQVAQAGVRRVVFCTGYRGEQVQAAFGTRYGALQLEYSQEPTPHGTAGAIRLAPYNAPLEVFSALDRQVIATALGRLADGSLDTGIDPATGEEK